MISSSDATTSNTLKLVSSYHCDDVEHKALRVNGETMNRNLAISVTDYSETTYTTKAGYLMLCIVILGVEILGLGAGYRRRKVEETLELESA